MRKAFRIFVLLAVFIEGAAFGPLRVEAAAAKIRIFVGLGSETQPQDQAKFDAIAKLWNDANLDLQINFDVVTTDPQQQFSKELLSDNPPDIAGPVGLGDIYAASQLWTDLTPYVRNDSKELNLPDYDDRTLQLFQLPGGKIAALPFDVYPSVLFVNEDRFRSAEVPLPPKEWGAPYKDKDGDLIPWDWDALAKVAQAVTSDNNGKYANEAGFDPNAIVTYGFGNQGIDVRSFVSAWGPVDAGAVPDGRTATFNQDAYRKAFTWLNVGIFQQHFVPDPQGWQAIDTLGSQSPFATGQIGMWYSQSQILCCLQSANFKWNAYVGPSVPGTNGKKISVPLHADAFAMTTQSRNQIGAWRILKWLNSAEVAPQLCVIYGCMPARKSARAEWEKATRTAYPALDVKLIEAAIPYLDYPNYEGALPNSQQALDVLSTYYARIQSDPKIDVAKGLDAINRQIQDIYHGKFTPTPIPTRTPTQSPTPTATKSQ